MRRPFRRLSYRRFVRTGVVGASLLSISNPSIVSALDVGLYDFHNNAPLGTLPNLFPGSTLGVSVAVGDLNGDGVAEVITGSGGGAGGLTGLFAFVKGESKEYPISKRPLGGSAAIKIEIGAAGVSVAAGDLNGDGHADLVLGPASGGGSSLAALCCIQKCCPDLNDHLEGSELARTPALFPEFSGGLSIAVGDLDGDSMPDIVAASRGDDHIKKVWIHLDSANNRVFEGSDIPLPFGVGERGMEIAVGDLDGDGLDDIIASVNQTPDGQARMYGWWKHDGIAQWSPLSIADQPAGVHIAVGDLDGDGRDDLIVGSAVGQGPSVTTYKFAGMATGALVKDKMLAPYPSSYRGGVNVAVGDLNGDGFADVVFAPAGVPEPASLASLATGLAAWLFRRRKRRDVQRE